MSIGDEEIQMVIAVKVTHHGPEAKLWERGLSQIDKTADVLQTLRTKVPIESIGFTSVCIFTA